MKSKPKIYFRADGNSKIGLGHVIRSLALADMLKDNFNCYFIIQKPSVALKKQILEVCKSIIEIEESDDYNGEANLISDNYLLGSEIVVLDGYFFNTAYQKTIKTKGSKLVCIDDIFAYHFVANLIINHTSGILPEKYSCEKYTRFCLGLDYALLRKPFREAAKSIKEVETNNNIFVCLGGADPKNQTIEVLDTILKIGCSYNIQLVIGSAYSHKPQLEKYIKNSPLNITLYSSLSADKMLQVMIKCSKAIISPSSISLEYLCTKGELYLLLTADNQKHLYHYFIDKNIAQPITDFSLNDNKGVKVKEHFMDGLQEERYLKVFKTL